jgi:hypothetical protein
VSRKFKWVFFLLVMLMLIVVGNLIFQFFFGITYLYAFAIVWGFLLGVFLNHPFLVWLGLREKR